MNTTNKVDWNAEVAQAVLAMKEEGQKAYTYMKSEAPEIAQEYVRWQIVKGLSGSVPLVLAGVITLVFAVKSYRRWKWEEANVAEYRHRGDYGFYSAMACLAAVFLLTVAAKPASIALKAFAAPRIVIIEGIKSIVR